MEVQACTMGGFPGAAPKAAGRCSMAAAAARMALDTRSPATTVEGKFTDTPNHTVKADNASLADNLVVAR